MTANELLIGLLGAAIGGGMAGLAVGMVWGANIMARAIERRERKNG